MSLAGVYIDESGSHKGAPVLCVAGYLVESANVIDMSAEWRKILNEKRVDFFHMGDCAHRNGPFKHLDLPDRIYVATRMIEIIKRHVAYGFAVTVNEDEFRRIVPKHPEIGSPYSFCVRYCLAAVHHWVKRVSFRGDIAYFFEAGHASQGEANRIMQTMFKETIQREKNRYISHTFADKKKMLPLQSADLLAWQWYTNSKRQIEGKPPRKDCLSLMQNDKHEVSFWDTPKLHELVATLSRRSEEIFSQERRS